MTRYRVLNGLQGYNMGWLEWGPPGDYCDECDNLLLPPDYSRIINNFKYTNFGIENETDQFYQSSLYLP